MLNSTCLLRLRGISGEFGRAMVRILTRPIQAKNTHGETKRACYAAET